MKRSCALESLPPSLNQANVGFGNPVAPQGSRITSPLVTSVVSGRLVMVGLKNLEDDDDSEVDAAVTFAEWLNSDLPEAEARHLYRPASPFLVGEIRRVELRLDKV